MRLHMKNERTRWKLYFMWNYSYSICFIYRRIFKAAKYLTPCLAPWRSSALGSIASCSSLFASLTDIIFALAFLHLARQVFFCVLLDLLYHESKSLWVIDVFNLVAYCCAIRLLLLCATVPPILLGAYVDSKVSILFLLQHVSFVCSEIIYNFNAPSMFPFLIHSRSRNILFIAHSRGFRV